MTKPNLFVVGAAKAGTTSIYHYLSQHPDVYMSPIKETYFFGQDLKKKYDFGDRFFIDMEKYFEQRPLKVLPSAFVSKLADYNRLYKESGSAKIIGEASTAHLVSEFAAQEIYNYNSEAKIIIILRDPIQRLISEYLMFFTSGLEKEREILKAINKKDGDKGIWGLSTYIEKSLYYDQIKRYFKVFPKEHILVLNYEDLGKETNTFMEKIFHFLNIEKLKNLEFNTKHNVTTGVIKNNISYQIIKIINKQPEWVKSFITYIGLKKSYKKVLAPKLYISKKDFKISETDMKILEETLLSDWKNTKSFLENEGYYL